MQLAEVAKDARELLAADSVALAAFGALLVPIIAFLWRLVTGTWPLIHWVISKYRMRQHVVVIRSSQSPDFDDFVDLYHDAFPEDERVATEEIQCWLDGKADAAQVEYQVYLARSQGRSEAFAICILDRQREVLYLPFFGVSERCQRWKTTRQVAARLLSAVRGRSAGWDVMVMEVLDPQEAGISTDEARRRAARGKRLHAIASSLNTKLHRVEATYIGPPFETDVAQSPGRPVMLFLMFKDRRLVDVISKERLLEVLRFLYRDVYVKCCPGPDRERAAYAAWVEKELERQQRVLPPSISLTVELRH